MATWRLTHLGDQSQVHSRHSGPTYIAGRMMPICRSILSVLLASGQAHAPSFGYSLHRQNAASPVHSPGLLGYSHRSLP